MAKFQIKSGRTSQMVNIFVQNNSVTTGAGLTGLSNNSSNLIGHFIRENDSASTPIAIVSAAIGTFTTGGIIEIESSAMPGLYQVGLPNAICSAGTSRWATVYYFGATNMAPSILEIELTQTDNQDVVRGGMTALPNAAAAAANGLLTAGTGANQISTSAGAMLIQAGAATGQLDFTAGVVKANLTQTLGTTSTGQAGSVGIDWAQIVNKTAVVDLTQTIISSVSGGVTVTTNNDKTGYSLSQSFPSNFSSLSITAAGLVATTSNVKKNQALAAFTFLMTDSTTHAPKTGVTVTATRSLDGGAFGSCANAATEITSGWYKIDLAATDLNANVVSLRFTGTSADDRDIQIVTQP